ncbi:MAG: hypothetical protein ABL893_17585 [Hyphomicrobium sp.]
MKKPAKPLPYKSVLYNCFVTMPIQDGALHEPQKFIRKYTEEMLSHFEHSGEEVVYARAVLEITTKLPSRH